MNDENSIALRIEGMETLRTLAKAYAQISSSRMKKTRKSVLTNREFLEAIDNIFQEIRASYRKKVMALAKRKRNKDAEKLTFLAHNGRSVAVFLSANTGLYGDLMQRTFSKFSTEVESGQTEATIIGKYGRSLFLAANPKRPHTYFDLPDHGIATDNLVKIINHLVQYEEIHIYHGKFNNLINQEAIMFNISAQSTVAPMTEKKEKQIIRFLFEPSLKQLLMFFETEMFGSLFEQSVRESQLAKFAARMLAMDRASQNIKKELTKMQLVRLRVAHTAANRKQLNSLSSLYALGF